MFQVIMHQFKEYTRPVLNWLHVCSIDLLHKQKNSRRVQKTVRKFKFEKLSKCNVETFGALRKD
jgi:hypothetical protein